MKPVCAIVGFGPGLGAAIARRFAAGGFAIGALARNGGRLEEHMQALRREDCEARGYAGDAASAPSLSAAFAKLRAEMGDPEVLVCNTVEFEQGFASGLKRERLSSYLDSHLGGALQAAQEVLPAMRRAGRGSLLFTGGGLALEPGEHPDWALLSMTKSALRALAFSLEAELASTGVRAGTVTICGTIAPGTSLDPALIAAQFWQLHAAVPPRREVVLK